MARRKQSRTWSRLGAAFGPGLVALLMSLPLIAAEETGDDWDLDAETDGTPADGTSADQTETPDEGGATDVSEGSAADPEGTGHGGQFGLRVGVVGGYRMMFRYADSPFCGPPGTDDAESCFYGAPWNLDVALGYAPFDALEVFGWGRFGLGHDTETDTDPLRAFGAGVRIYTMNDAPLKFFVQPAVAMSFEGGGQDPLWRSRGATRPQYDSDLLFHFSVGPQYDFNRQVGAYAGLGMTVGARRAMSATLEGTLGLQARYP